MVEIEIISTGRFLTSLDSKITYIKQVADIGDITKLNTSYSWSMKFPKTPENSIALDSLGVVGSMSETPYLKTHVNLYDNGEVIVRKGLLNITETSNEYKIFIQEGIVDFIKSLGNDKIGEVIDLSELDHSNSVNTIIDSFEQNTYRYIINDYNGAPLANKDYNGVMITDINPSSLIPSINCKYLLDKIMEHYEWTYSGNLNIDNLWMTYPNAISFSEIGSEVMALSSSFVQGVQSPNGNMGFSQAVPFTEQIINSSHFELISNSQDSAFRCLTTGYYKISFVVYGLVTLYEEGEVSFSPPLYVNGTSVAIGNFSSVVDWEDNRRTVTLILNTGDELRLLIEPAFHFQGDEMAGPADIYEARMEVVQLGIEDVSFSSALIKLGVNAFFKEIMIRTSCVSFTDIDDKHITFKTLDERLSADVIDFSDKYVRRISERYLYNNYARNNYLKHKYDEDGDDYNDGNLTVLNENLDIEKDLYNSFSYAALDELEEYNGFVNPSYFVHIFKMFDVEVKEEPETLNLIANYKPLKNRFYFMESETKTEFIYIFGILVSSFPTAKITNTTFRGVVFNKYSKINQLIRRAKVHEIELALSTYDVSLLDLSKRYYIAQQKSYYIFNKLKYSTGKLSVGEFIKIENT